MKITKEFKFEMAHKLYKSYTPKCRHIHGHSYRLEVSLFNEFLNSEDVVVDFTRVKEVVQPYIDKLDHALMIYGYDSAKNALVELADKESFPLLLCSKNPTAEVIAEMFAHSVYAMFREVVARVKICVWETATSKACCKVDAANFNLFKTIESLLVFAGEEQT